MNQSLIHGVLPPELFKRYIDEMMEASPTDMINLYGEVSPEHPMAEYFKHMVPYLEEKNISFFQGVCAGLCFFDRAMMENYLEKLK